LNIAEMWQGRPARVSSFYIWKCRIRSERSKSDKKTAGFQQNTDAFVKNVQKCGL
jgi:hypothetical protein